VTGFSATAPHAQTPNADQTGGVSFRPLVRLSDSLSVAQQRPLPPLPACFVTRHVTGEKTMDSPSCATSETIGSAGTLNSSTRSASVLVSKAA
jgi:hypothetical protein